MVTILYEWLKVKQVANVDYKLGTAIYASENNIVLKVGLPNPPQCSNPAAWEPNPYSYMCASHLQQWLKHENRSLALRHYNIQLRMQCWWHGTLGCHEPRRYLRGGAGTSSPLSLSRDRVRSTYALLEVNFSSLVILHETAHNDE